MRPACDRANRSGGGAYLLALGLLGLVAAAAAAEPVAGESALPPLERPGQPYHTPRAGEGFQTQLFGRTIEVAPRDRRSVTALQLGADFTAPGPSGSEVLPYGAVFLFQRPDQDRFFEAILVGVQNELIYARSPRGFGPFELLATFENSTIPVARAEVVEGSNLRGEELLWGSLYSGFGLGYRVDVAPEQVDNMFAAGLFIEPGFLYFDEGNDTRPDFVVPSDTFELRARLRVAYDGFERNLLELTHQGFGFGFDAIVGHRANWQDWGVMAREDADTTRTYESIRGYLKLAGGVPFQSERHRLISSIHFAVGDDVDRFSAPRIGGGPEGDEFKANARPLIPGALVEEYAPDHYFVALGEYRYELLFFTYLSVRGSVSWLDRDRLRGGDLVREHDWLTSIGTRLTTGFPFGLWLRIDYNYNFDVVRRGGQLGGHEVLFGLAREF